MDSKEGAREDKLPSPVVQSPAVRPWYRSPVAVIPLWIFLSSSVILFNKRVLSQMNFGYPITLVTWHLVFASIATRVLKRTTRLLDSLQHVNMTWETYLRRIVPIGVLFAFSLMLSNAAYLTLSVSYIQMVKAFTAVAVYGFSVAFGIQTASSRTLTIIGIVCGGVALASLSEANFDMLGFGFQCAAIVFEAARLTAIELLLKQMKLDPLASLYMFAPPCALITASIIPFTEGFDPLLSAVDVLGLPVLFANAGCALALNLSVLLLIGCASAVVLTLAGVVKDILLVVLSVVLMGSTVTSLQIFGYAVALAALYAFKMPKDQLDGLILRVRNTAGIR